MEAAGLGVFNRVLEKFTQSERALPHRRRSHDALCGVCSRKMLAHEEASRHPRSLMLVLMSKNKDDANGALRVALRAVAKPGLAIEL